MVPNSNSFDPPTPQFHQQLIDNAIAQLADFWRRGQTASPETITRNAFERRIEEIKPSKTDINLVIMDYLINEGYPVAAKKFAAEANISHPTGDAEYIEERVEIRNAILAGDIQKAIGKINDLNPELLDLDTSLHFALLRLQLIELIRQCTSTPNADITPALDFASTHLAPRAPTNPEFLTDLERTMALLIFPSDNLTPPLSGLLDPDLRQTVAMRVNEAILESQGFRKQARLKSLVKLRAWAERKAREQGKDLPKKLDLFVEGDEISKDSNGGAEGRIRDSIISSAQGDSIMSGEGALAGDSIMGDE